MPTLVSARCQHSCCAVRGALVVLGGRLGGEIHALEFTSSVEILSEGVGFVELPPLSCGGISRAVAIAVKEENSAAGQLHLLGGRTWDGGVASTVQLVDLATGVCTSLSALLQARWILDARWAHRLHRRA